MTKLKQFELIVENMMDTYKRKNNNYGDSFGESFEELGLISAVTRMNDKMNRLKSLASGNIDSVGEALEDTLLDLANYAVMTLIEIQRQQFNERDYLSEALAFDLEGITPMQLIKLDDDAIEVYKAYMEFKKGVSVCEELDEKAFALQEKITRIIMFLELNDVTDDVGFTLITKVAELRDKLAEVIFGF